MGKITRFISEKYATYKCNRLFARLSENHIQYPQKAENLHAVLVILPRQVDYTDSAIRLVNQLRQDYTAWKFKMLDVDKIPPTALNRLELPSDAYISELKQLKSGLVLDLNFDLDIRTAYLIAMLNIPFRVHLLPTAGEYYNIIVQTSQKQPADFEYVRDHVRMIFQTN